MTKNDTTLSSGLLGLLTGLLFGWSLGNILLRYIELDKTITLMITMLLLGVGGLILGLTNPVFVESLIFGITILIFAQFFWDYGAEDLNDFRFIMFFSALILFTLNLFTGKLKVGTAKKVLRKQLGMR